MKVIVDNIATEYSDEGKGPTILMLHGWMDTHHTFDRLAGVLGLDYRLVRLDMPGFGQTEAPKEAWSVGDYATFVSHFSDKLGLKPDVILGHSFGGRVTIKGVSTGVFKPRKLILVGSAGISKRITFRNIFFTTVAKIFGIVTYIPPLYFYRDKIRKKLYAMIGSDYLESGVLRDTYLKVISEDLKEDASHISLPTQLIWGENDTETPLADGRQFSLLINGSSLSVVAGAGHMVHQEKAEEVARIIKDFV